MYKIANKLMASGRLERPSIDDVVAGLGDLPTLAPVAVEVLRLADDEDSSLSDLVAVIKTDPSLSARLLRVANSAIYGQTREVTNLLRATTLLGLRTVKLLSLGFSLVSNLSAGAVNTTLIWRRSLVGSVLAQKLSSNRDQRMADDAFVTGLLSNIGLLAMVKVPVYSAQLTDQVPWLSGSDEETLLGFTADEVTEKIFASWNLPESMGSAVRYRTHPNHPDCIHPNLSGILQVADAGALLLLAGTEVEQAQAYNDLVFSAATHLGFTASQMEDAISDAGPELDDVSGLFEMQSVTAVPVAEIAAAAQSRIANLGMEGDHESSTLATEAATDPVTGLANRRTLEAYLDNQINAHVAVPRPTELGVLVIDIDQIKSVNTTHGRHVGDQLLQSLGRRLSDAGRGRDLVARTGSDEFTVVVGGVSRSELETLARRVLDTCNEVEISTEVGPIEVSVAVGGCHVKSGQLAGTQDRETLLTSALQAVHVARRYDSSRYEVLSFGESPAAAPETSPSPPPPKPALGTGLGRGGGLGARLAAAEQQIQE